MLSLLISHFYTRLRAMNNMQELRLGVSRQSLIRVTLGTRPLQGHTGYDATVLHGLYTDPRLLCTLSLHGSTPTAVGPWSLHGPTLTTVATRSLHGPTPTSIYTGPLQSAHGPLQSVHGLLNMPFVNSACFVAFFALSSRWDFNVLE